MCCDKTVNAGCDIELDHGSAFEIYFSKHGQPYVVNAKVTSELRPTAIIHICTNLLHTEPGSNSKLEMSEHTLKSQVYYAVASPVFNNIERQYCSAGASR